MGLKASNQYMGGIGKMERKMSPNVYRMRILGNVSEECYARSPCEWE